MRRIAVLSSLILVYSALAASAETVVRYGISLADIPLTTGQPDRGSEKHRLQGAHRSNSVEVLEIPNANEARLMPE